VQNGQALTIDYYVIGKANNVAVSVFNEVWDELMRVAADPAKAGASAMAAPAGAAKWSKTPQ